MDKNIISRIEFARLIAFQKLGILSERDEKKLDDWLLENISNQKTYEQLMIENVKHDESPDAEKRAWTLFVKKYHIQEQQPTTYKWNIYAIACSIILLIGFCTWLLQEKNLPTNIPKPTRTDVAQLILDNGDVINLDGKNLVKKSANITIHSNEGKIDYSVDREKQQKEEINYHTILVPQYGEYSIQLADGSTVKLNAESSLKFPTNFPDSIREVWLSGEAYFDIKQDSSKHFIVHTLTTNIIVRGTEFNVNAYAYQNSVKTTLLKGSVEISYQGNSRFIHPGQQAITSESDRTILIKEIVTQDETAWMRGMFCFNERPLTEIMDKLSRWYGFNVVFENSELKQRHFSVELPKYAHVDEILKLIEEINIVKFKKEGKTIKIY